MALKIESLSKLLVKLKVAPDEAVAKELITSKEEKDVALPDGIQFFTKEELATRDGSGKSTHIQAGKEISVKELKELAGLTYDGEGSKDPKKFLEEYKKSVLAESGTSTDEKIQERDKTITKLRDNIKTLESQQASFQKEAKEAKLNSDITLWTSDLKPDNMEPHEWVSLIRMNNDLVEENGQLYVKRGGEIVKDAKLQTPIAAKDALRAFVTERKWAKEAAATGGNGDGQGGRGGGDSKGATSGITKMSQFKKHMEDNGINPMGMEAQAMLTKITGSNKDFDYDH